MARTAAAVAARDVRRDAFVDAAMRLIQTKGYQQMSVQDVLDELDASRGAFYHYFESKRSLLDAVGERMVDAVLAEVEPAVNAPGLSAPARLETLFGGIASWKGSRTQLMLEFLRTWMDDDNALTRDKFRRGLVPRLVPLISRIIDQGNAEGSFDAGDPKATAHVLVSLIAGLNEQATELFFARQAGTVTFDEVDRIFAAFTTAFERLLGLSPGSLTLGTPEVLRYWFDSPIPLTQERP